MEMGNAYEHTILCAIPEYQKLSMADTKQGRLTIAYIVYITAYNTDV